MYCLKLDLLAQTMDEAITEMRGLPDDKKWTDYELDTLELIRHHAVRLKLDIEAIFEDLEGKE
jgi:hypothetical protein